MKTSTLRRGGLATAALALTLGLAACGDDSDSTDGTGDSSGGMSDRPTTSAPSMEPTPSESPDAGAQAFGPACSSIPSSGPGSFEGMVMDPVATAASNNPLLSTLVTAVTEAGLVDTLNGAEGLTVFAPTNDAFDALPEGALDDVLADKDLLTQVLTHHVVEGMLDPDAVAGTQTTLNGDTISVGGDTGGMEVDGAQVLCGNIPTANATVYVVDTVLMPAGM